MDSHKWTNGTEVFEAVAFQIRTSAGEEVGNGAVARELLRLAQREADLEAVLATMGERDGQHLARIAALEAEQTALEDDLRRARGVAERTDQTNTDLRAAMVEKEHQLGLAKATIKGHVEELGRRVIRNAQLRQQLDAEQSRGRQYCLELVDRAADIEEFKRERDAAVQLAADYQHQLVNLNASETAEMTRLRAAIEDGIAHVEKARQGLSIMGTVTPITGLPVPLEQLDLAHEALSKASQPVPGVGTAGGVLGVDSAKPGAERTVYVVDLAESPSVRERLAALEEWARRLQPEGMPIGARLDSLEGSRKTHALMLTDHADRLRALEPRLDEVDHLLAQHHRRLATFEAGKE